MKILAIETSCDETAIALVEAKGGLTNPQFKIIKNLVASQIKFHQPFGGVVPNIAKREHLKNLPLLMNKIMNNELGIRNKKSKIHNSKFIIPDLIAVTTGPGLEPALWAGITFAKDLHKKINNKLRIKNKKTIIHNSKFIIPIQGVSHLDGHLYSLLLQNNQITNYKKPINQLFPAIALIISGGHTILLKMDSLTKIKKLGETVDDAVGEAFDKVARMLDLPYPGGPEIEKLAKKGNPKSINFPRPMLNQKNYNFSFSGLKTSVLYYMRGVSSHSDPSADGEESRLKADVAASFQQATFDVLIKKTLRAAKEFKAKSIFISGGVSANKTLAKEFKRAIAQEKVKWKKEKGMKVQFPISNLLFTKYPTDNAAMIAAAAYINFLRKKKYPLKANGNLSI